MNPVDKVFILELTDGTTLVSSNVTIEGGKSGVEGLLVVKNPVWWMGGKPYLLKGRPEEIFVNVNSILFSYSTNDSSVAAEYNMAWGKDGSHE